MKSICCTSFFNSLRFRRQIPDIYDDEDDSLYFCLEGMGLIEGGLRASWWSGSVLDRQVGLSHQEGHSPLARLLKVPRSLIVPSFHSKVVSGGGGGGGFVSFSEKALFSR